MRHPIFSALSLATLLLACAHDSKNQRVANHETNAERAETRVERKEQRAENEARKDEERVEVPQRRGDRDRVASAGGAVPARTHDEARSDTKDKLTALDQGNNEVDLDLTQRIRKAVMADDSLSFAAKNAKIIARDGHVTLHGSVKTAAEKEAIYKCAVSAAGVGHVSNELEIDSD